MAKLSLKYIPQCTVHDGNILVKVRESARINVDDKQVKSELMDAFERNSQIYYTENGSFSGYHFNQTERDIRDNDPGSIQIYIHNNVTLLVLKAFLNQHPQAVVEIDKDSVKRDYLTKLLTELDILPHPKPVYVQPIVVVPAPMLESKAAPVLQPKKESYITSVCTLFGGAAGLYLTAGSAWGAVKGAVVGAAVGALIDASEDCTRPRAGQ